METILCTQCQHENPHYTKFCLTCGAVTIKPKKRETAALRETKLETTPPAVNGSNWLTSIKRLWS